MARGWALAGTSSVIAIVVALVAPVPAASGAIAPERPALHAVTDNQSAAAKYSRSSRFSSGGYTYRISISISVGNAELGNSTSLPPGQTAIYQPVSAQLTVRNQTPGRDAPVPLPLESAPVDALWKVPTPLCMPNASFMGGTPDALHEKLGQTWYCLGITFVDIQNSITLNSNNGDLGPGQAVTEKLAALGCQSASVNNFSCPAKYPVTDNVVIASTSSAKKVLGALRAKPQIVLAYFSLGKFSPSYDVCTAGGSASGYGSWAWVIASRSRLAAGKCS